MTQLTGDERAAYVRDMFTRIAKRYDLMNRLMTGGQDVRWRKRVIELARLDNHASLLDLGTGTGDLAREALAAYHESLAVSQRLAEAEPSNAGWQHDLSVSHERVGDVRLQYSRAFWNEVAEIFQQSPLSPKIRAEGALRKKARADITWK